MHSDASVKVRDGVLDVKVLHRVDGSGLQLWVPVMKAPFPLDAGAVTAAFAALGASLPGSRRAEHSMEQLVDELVGTRDDLRVVGIRKRRRRSVLDDCMVELTEVIAEGRTIRTVAVESPDPDLVSSTVRRLGLDGRSNTCVAQGLKSLLGWGPRRFAVIDVGTNSVKFTLGHRDEGGTPHSDLDTAVITRLGEGLAAAGELTAASMGRTVDAIGDLVDEARRGGPLDIVAVGTAGLRQASNRDDFVAAVHARCGVVVEVISGREEARLAYLAAVSALPLTGDRLLVFDSGGGSSQFTFGRSDRIEQQFSVDVGAVRFTERFGLADAVPRETVEAALGAIATDLADLRSRPRPDTVIAIGGTSTNLAAVKHGLDHYDPDVVHGDRRGRGRGGSSDRGVPARVGRRAARHRRPAACAGRGDPRRRLHHPHDPDAHGPAIPDRQRPRVEAWGRRREVRLAAAPCSTTGHSWDHAGHGLDRQRRATPATYGALERANVRCASIRDGPYHVSSRPLTSSVGVRVNASGPSSGVKT